MAVTITGAKAAGTRVKQTLDAIVGRQVKYAAWGALNDTARDAQLHVRKVMPQYLDKPTPYTQRQVFYDKAEYSALRAGNDLTASVYIPYEFGSKSGRPAAKYLRWQVYGGARVPKGFEEALRSKGVLLGGEFVVPASGTRLDPYGNIPASFIRLILSYFNAAELRAGYQANLSDRKRRLLEGKRAAGVKISKRDRARPGFSAANEAGGRFKYGTVLGTSTKKYGGQEFGRMFIGGRARAGKKVSYGRHLKPGIYSSTGVGGSNIKPLLLFTRQPFYGVRFPFHRIVEGTAPRFFRNNFRRRLEQALATARPATP